MKLHVRSNVSGFLTSWSEEGAVAELTPRLDARWPGHQVQTGEVFVVPGSWEFGARDKVTRMVIVFARSQTEVPATTADVDRRLRDLQSRVGPEGAPQILKAVDERTRGELGVYVVNRVGMPVAAEIVLPARRR